MDENLISNKQSKRDFARIGFALTAMVVAIYVARYPISYLIKSCFPVLLKPQLIQWTRLGVSAVCIYLIGFPILLLVLRKMPSIKAQHKQKIGIGGFFAFLVIALGAMYLSNFVTVCIVMILSWIKGSMLINPLETLQNGSMVANILYGAILAPIMEEVIFRGVLINKLRKYGDIIAIIASALAFGLIHGNISQVLYAFVAGLVFAYITLRTGTIRHSIFIHVIVNSFGLVIAPFIAKQENVLLMLLLLMVVFTVVIVGTLLVVFNFRKIRLEQGNAEIPTKQLVKQLLFNWGMISYYVVSLILIVYMIVVT